MQTYDEVGSRREVLAVPDLVEALVQEPLVSYPVVPDPPVEVDDLKLVALGGAVLSQPRVYLLHQGVTLNFRICIWIYTEDKYVAITKSTSFWNLYQNCSRNGRNMGPVQFFFFFFFFIFFFFFFGGGVLCPNSTETLSEHCSNLPEYPPNFARIRYIGKMGGGGHRGPLPPISYAYGNCFKPAFE